MSPRFRERPYLQGIDRERLRRMSNTLFCPLHRHAYLHTCTYTHIQLYAYINKIFLIKTSEGVVKW